MIPVKRTESRLLGLIKHRTRKGKIWTQLNLVDLARLFHVSERTVRRAKANLEGRPDLVRFRTVSTGPGRGHKIIAALVSDLSGTSGELLPKDTAGKARAIRTKIGGQRVEKPQPPANIKKESFHDSFKQTPAIAGLAKRQASPRQKKLAHVLKRQLWDWESWENMKVARGEAYTYGYCVKALAAGFSVQAIRKAFAESLRESHGLATDIGLGLANGNPTQNIFCSSSTVSKAWNRLKAWRIKSLGPRVSASPNYTRHRSRSSEQKGNPPNPGMTRNPTKHMGTRHDPRPHMQDQSPRFASIMEALA